MKLKILLSLILIIGVGSAYGAYLAPNKEMIKTSLKNFMQKNSDPKKIDDFINQLIRRHPTILGKSCSKLFITKESEIITQYANPDYIAGLPTEEQYCFFYFLPKRKEMESVRKLQQQGTDEPEATHRH